MTCSHFDRVREMVPQARERVAQRRLAYPEAPRRARHALLAQERVERREEVRVDAGQFHCRHFTIDWSRRTVTGRIDAS